MIINEFLYNEDSNKIVKESLNEIVRGKESAINSLGIGKATMFKAYKYATQYWPKWIAKNSTPMDEKFANNKFKFLSRMETKFEISMNDYLWIDWSINLNQEFDKWLKSIKAEKTLAINPSTWDNNDVRIAKYNYEWNMGYLSISNGLFDNDKIQGYFFKYK